MKAGSYKMIEEIKKKGVKMNKIKHTIILLLGFMLASSLSACANRSIPQSYAINGVTYQTGFYGNLFANSQSTCFVGDLYEKSDDVWNEEYVVIGNTDGYQISYAPFDIFSIRYGIWQHHLYVAKDRFDEAKQYYASYEAYHFYWAKGVSNTHFDEFHEIEANQIINKKLDELLIVEEKNPKKHENILLGDQAYFFYKISDDGLLTSLRKTYYINEGKLYLFSFMKNDNMYLVEIEDDLSNFFVGLIQG